MFNLAELKDTIRIPPAQFDQDMIEVLEEHLNVKFANKVIKNVGLCIVLFDILKIGESIILPGDGAPYTKVFFRVVVFRPFIDEVLIGKVRSCSRDGVHVTLGFFDDVIIPMNALQHPSRFDEKEQLWAWEYVNEETNEKHNLYIDKDEKIRFRVIEEKFSDSSPAPPSATSDPSAQMSPYVITGSIGECGLGLLSWWS